MAIDPEVKKALDLRLASGAISREEYLSLCNTVSVSPPNRPGTSFCERALNSVTALQKRIWETRKVVSPSDDAPYIVDEGLVLFGHYLTYRDAVHPYLDIERITYKAQSSHVNLVPILHQSHLWVRLKGGISAFAGSSTTLFKGKTFNRVLNAYDFLMRITFKQRLEPYLRNLETHGCCEIAGANIYRSGDVDKNGVRVDLRLARKNKGLNWWGMGSDAFCNYEILKINETGKTLSGRKIRLEIAYDQDVARALLVWLSEQPCIL